MIKIALSVFPAALVGLCLHLPPAQAQAQLARTFVSAVNGSDGNDCNRLTPCRTFQHAHDQTLPLGEITVLDPGGYGAVSITKGISIINDGVGEAGVLVSGGLIGIEINAGATDKVTLRGLTVKGIGFGGGNGIRLNRAASLSIEKCVIRNHGGDGVQMLGDLPQGGVSTFTISNTVVSDNGGNGIFIRPIGLSSGGTLKVILNRVEMYNNSAHGFAVVATLHAFIRTSVTNSVSGGNGLSGFYAERLDSSTIVVMVVKRSLATANADRGFFAKTAHIYLSDSVATFNGAEGWAAIALGELVSFQDNLDFGNGAVSFGFPADKN